jgi:signal transduction histidine kinase
MRRHLLTTRGRLTIAAAALLLAVLAGSDIVLSLALVVIESRSLEVKLRDQVVSVAGGLRLVDDHIVYERGDLPDETSDGTAIDLAVTGSRGLLLTTRDEPIDPASLMRVAHRVGVTRRPALIDIAGQDGDARRLYAAPVRVGGDREVVIGSTPLAPMYASQTWSISLIAVLSAAILAAGSGLTYWLVGRALRPVSRIAELAETLSDRDLFRRVDVDAPDDELGQLVATFNRMLTRLEASFQSLRDFTSNASHELRGPLAVMAAEVELGLNRPRSEMEYRQALRVLQAEIGGMTRLVEKLLLLTRADAGTLKANRSRVDLVDIVHEVVARWRSAARRKAVELELQVPDAGTALADEDLFRRALDNVIDNAIRCSASPGRVRVHVRHRDRAWLIQVMDQGPGVPEALRDHIFERFGSVDGVRTRAGGGLGLGLPLSRAFMRAQSGDLMLGAEQGWSAVFELCLPD